MRPLLLLLALAFAPACRAVPDAGSGTIQHVVLLWQKDPGDAVARERLLATSRSFTALPGVASVHAGTALPSERELVDDTFDVALVMTFASETDLEAYLVHPDHVRAVEEVLVPLVERVVVYDVVD